MKRHTRQNPLATAKDIADMTIVGVGGDEGQIEIGGVAKGPTFGLSATTWDAVNDKPDVAVVQEAPLNPERYGALGDGSTDDTEAIQDAMTAFMQAQAIYGGGSAKTAATLQFRRGRRYIITETLNVPIAVNTTGGSIIGHGSEIVLDSETDLYAINIDTEVSTAGYWRNFTLDGLVLRDGGLRLHCTPVAGLDYVYGWEISDLFVEGAKGHGLMLSGAFEGVVRHPRIGLHSSVTAYDCIHLPSSPQPSSSVAIFGGVTRRGRHGLYSNGADVNVYGFTALESLDYGLNMADMWGNTLAGIHIERCQRGKADLTSGAAGAGMVVTGGAHIDSVFAIDATDIGLRRMTYAVLAYATASRSIVVTNGVNFDVPTHTYVNGTAASDVTLIGVPSYTEATNYSSSVGGRLTVIGKGDNLARNKRSEFHRNSGTDVAIATRLGSETMDRLGITALGQLQWAGSGSTPDATMGRASANLVEMGAGDSFKVDGTYNGGTLRLGSNYVWVDAAGTTRIKSSLPNTDTDGTPIGVPAAVTTANLEDITHGINVTGKYAGKRVYCSTHGRWHWTAGATAGSVWKDWNGTADVTAHTPA